MGIASRLTNAKPFHIKDSKSTFHKTKVRVGKSKTNLSMNFIS